MIMQERTKAQTGGCMCGAVALLDEVHGNSTPDDLLDRIFSRFCLGK